MSYVTVNQATTGEPIKLYYEDWGSGSPVVLIHGWPVNQRSWEYQKTSLAQAGLRVIAYDRRGFGQSSKPWSGYDYDTFADDLKAVLDELNLSNVTLVGFSMGGGEVARYMSRHRGARVERVAFISAVTPYLLRTDDNPDGVDRDVFDDMVEGLVDDRPAFLKSFGKQFFSAGMMTTSVSEETLAWAHALALEGSPKATLDCVRAFSETDFRGDLATIKVPTLIIHGSHDKIVPAEVSSARTAKALPKAHYKVYDGAPHGLFITHKDELTGDLLGFINEGR